MMQMHRSFISPRRPRRKKTFTIVVIILSATILLVATPYAARHSFRLIRGGHSPPYPSCFANTKADSARRGNLGLFPAFHGGRRAVSSTMSLSTRANTDVNGSFSSFLDSVPSTLSEKLKLTSNSDDDGPAFRMIMGNEAGDADSIISALSLGYVKILQRSSKNGDDEDVIVPIVSVPRKDIALRRDVMLLLDMAGITIEKLLFVDDDIVSRNLLPPSSDDGNASSSVPSGASLTLVDHNRIKSSLTHLSPLVAEIVDHHEDEKSHGNVTTESGKRMIAFENGHATVASTCTLIAEILFQQTTTSGGESATISIDASLGLLLLGVILLDSVNMLPAAGKGTPRDEKALRVLLQHTDWESYDETTTMPTLVDKATMERIFPNGKGQMPDKTQLFEALSGAKNDRNFWLELSVMDCLRIDYKKFLVPDSGLVRSIGLSSVLIDMDSLLSKESFRDDLTKFVKSSDVGLFGILALDFRDGKPNRELLLAGPDPKIANSFTNYLLNHPDAAFLEFAEREECSVEGGLNDVGTTIRVFKQGNGKGSRKQVAPILLRHAAASGIV